MNKSHLPIGIDLGTSNSVVCIFEDGKAKPIRLPRPLSKKGNSLLPSLVGLSELDNKLYVGHKATEFEDDKDCFVREIKRHMGTDYTVNLGQSIYTPQEVSAQILKLLKEYTSETELGMMMNEAIISVPANFKDAQRQATLDAAKIAGLNVPMLIPEPTAAALAFGVNNMEIDENIVVFDFGGGTLDISLLEMFEGVIEVKRIDGDSNLGGKDIDDLVFNWVKLQVDQQYPGATWAIGDFALKSICEEAKVKLSSQNEYILSHAMALNYKGSHAPLELRLNQDIFGQIISSALDKATACLENILKGDGRQKKRIDRSSISRVLMVGGSTYIPSVRDRVSSVLNLDVSHDVDPDLAVGIGACLRSAIFQGAIEPEKEIMLADISPFSVGVEIVEIVNNHVVPGIFSPLIHQNAPIPTTSFHNYSLMHLDQSAVTIKLFQGNSKFTIENEMLAEAEIENIPPSETNTPRQLGINFKFDLSGIVSLDVNVEGTDLDANLSADPRQGRMDDAQLLLAQEKLSAESSSHQLAVENYSSIESLVENSPGYQKVKGIIRRAKKIINKNPNPSLEAAVNDLYQSLIEDDQMSINENEEIVTDLILESEY